MLCKFIGFLPFDCVRWSDINDLESTSSRLYFSFYGAGWPNSAFELKTTRRKSEERKAKNLASDQKR